MNPLVLQRPFWFFGVFALATLLLLPLWNGLADWYMAALTALVNAASAWTGLPSQFQFGALPQEQTINPSIVAGTALFIATPERSVRWKICWIVFLIAFLYLFQSLMLLLQVHAAYAHFSPNCRGRSDCTTTSPCSRRCERTLSLHRSSNRGATGRSLCALS